MTKQLNKSACLTDIHFGAKSNSDVHNNDCLQFIDWFCAQVKQDDTIDHVMFLGDWFENRSALNIATLNASYQGAKKLSELNLPVFFVIGNHDLYHRHTREVYSPIHFHEFKNFNIITNPTKVEQIGNGVLVSPYLFHEEYPDLDKYKKLDTWWGHFEFKGFVVTGYNIILPAGPDPADFFGPKRIFSGHFHKRQQQEHIVYMGNTFPTSFGDANDNNRGMMVYQHDTNSIEFKDWEDCPKYIKTNFSNMLDETAIIYPQSRIKCIVDIPITWEESTILKQKYMDDYNLRELVLEESQSTSEVLSETQTEVVVTNQLDSVDDLVVQMLKDINHDQYDSDLLIAQYKQLQV